jgi:hypothetical protein
LLMVLLVAFGGRDTPVCSASSTESICFSMIAQETVSIGRGVVVAVVIASHVCWLYYQSETIPIMEGGLAAIAEFQLSSAPT